jgi:hypothetical protein
VVVWSDAAVTGRSAPAIYQSELAARVAAAKSILDATRLKLSPAPPVGGLKPIIPSRGLRARRVSRARRSLAAAAVTRPPNGFAFVLYYLLTKRVIASALQ